MKGLIKLLDINYLKENGIDVDAGVEILGDIEAYNETLEDFLIECEERLPLIKEYKESGNMMDYATLVHAMKGDSKYLGFRKLADLSLEHQLKSQANDVAYVCSNYDLLIEEANRVIGVVKKYLGKE